MASEKAKALAAQQKAERKAEKLRKKNSDDPRDWGRIRQIIEAYKRTNEVDPQLKWWTLSRMVRTGMLVRERAATANGSEWVYSVPKDGAGRGKGGRR